MSKTRTQAIEVADAALNEAGLVSYTMALALLQRFVEAAPDVWAIAGSGMYPAVSGAKAAIDAHAAHVGPWSAT